MRPAAARSAFTAEFDLDATQTEAVDLLTQPDEHGVYLWGPVGRGKTWLLDRYFGGVATGAKRRVHFHHFFRDLHASYFRNGFSLERALDELLQDVRLLCFDEFHVHDVGDGRLIARLLDALLARKVTLVVTSNYPPEGLLPNPLFHHTFVPAIGLLNEHLRVVHIDGPVDYRSTGRPGASRFAAGSWTLGANLGARQFDELCDMPRSTGDYLAMTESIDEFAISGIPALADAGADAVQRFCNLVDVLYDRDIRTAFYSCVNLRSAAQGCAGLDVDRIVSRLSELREPSDPGN